jgi:hypothetical protein
MVDMTRGSSIEATWLLTVMRGRPDSRARAASMCWPPSTTVLLMRVMKPRLAWASMYMTAVCGQTKGNEAGTAHMA